MNSQDYAEHRRAFLKTIGFSSASLCLSNFLRCGIDTDGETRRPNICIAMADDWSWPHASVLGEPVVKTPAFDRIVREGVLFEHAFVSSPSCAPSRAATLTGRYHWELKEGANMWGTLPEQFTVYPDILEEAGYHVGFDGKGWGPGRLRPGGRERNPAGQRYRNFKQFLKKRPQNSPFCFWLGSRYPHRRYKYLAGVQAGLNPDNVNVPARLPDAPQVRLDICDYFNEVHRFDREVASMMKLLKRTGELDNTIVIVTSDNGMPFPGCKPNCCDMGIRVPLAVRWGDVAAPGRRVKDFVSLCDIAPTLLEAAGLTPLHTMSGRSFLDILRSKESGWTAGNTRREVMAGRERHITAQGNNLQGYPIRALRTERFLYIRNSEPDRWPAGDPDFGYRDVDTSPTKRYMVSRRDDPKVKPLFERAFGKRPPEELYDLHNDPGQLHNVATEPAYHAEKNKLAARLTQMLKDTDDPRMYGRGDVFDSYPYYMVKRVHQ